MSYVQVMRHRIPPQADSVRVSVQSQGNGLDHRPLTLGFYIGRDVANKLGWNARCRVNLFWGTDKHAGMARVELAERGQFVLQIRARSASGSSLYFKTAQLPPHVTSVPIMRASEVGHMILNNGLEITLPKPMQPKAPGPLPKYQKKFPDQKRGRPRAEKAEKHSPDIPAEAQATVQNHKQNGAVSTLGAR